MGGHEAFWIDHDYDRERSDLGISRYGEHVRRNISLFADSWGDIAPVTFASTAWRLATTPSLTPGYVRWHRRILYTDCSRNTWDGSLTAHVMLASPPPAELTASREWWHDRGWRGWPRTFGQFLHPSDEDVSKSPHLRPTLLIDAPVPLDHLPAAPEGPHADVEQAAHDAVIVMVRELNDLLTPILRRLDP
ncbi:MULTISPECIES: hypothetical protein [Thermomonospora]|uniref:Uncharacterized protein n=1 Tax=Thermomonospora cellulosilytica TaxID=1411118 RepID=A0A7W3MY61_9ACTN|nr:MULTISPECIES: hypothetical protein [Thermomonospora]MBA9004041.1 hypothetical protein [Thermomonospora cellulosilytica]